MNVGKKGKEKKCGELWEKSRGKRRREERRRQGRAENGIKGRVANWRVVKDRREEERNIM